MGESHRTDSAVSRDAGAVDADSTAARATTSVRGIQRRRAAHQVGTAVSVAAVAPAVELPAPVGQLAVAAVGKLGWHGFVLPEMTLVGRRVVVVAKLRTDAHAERICLSEEPVADRATVATWVWPEFANSAPPAAVDIVGVLGVARHWRTALTSAVPFAPYCPTGIVVPWDVAGTHEYLRGCLGRARSYGVSVLTADPAGEANLDQQGELHAPAYRETALTRWINELVYQRLLDTLEESVTAS